MKRTAVLVCALMLGLGSLSARTDTLMPTVKKLEKNGATFRLGRGVAKQGNAVLPYADVVLEEIGLTGPGNGVMVMELTDSVPGAYDYELADYPAECYTLSVGNDTIRISAVTETGVLRGLQTLRQLAQDSGGEIEGVEITDWPAFKLRGWLHDIGRSYISVDELKKQIDILSRFKVNTFHWHLTENQAFRMGSRKYPQLNLPENMTRQPGLYYTIDEMKEVEKYAAERGVTILPEIDMPGHSAAFELAMGHSMQTDKGVEELKELIEEICEAFPNAPYIHIGGDEKPITYPDFLKIMIDKTHSIGKKVAVWNPIHGVKVSKDMDIDLVTLWSTAGRKVDGVPNVDLRYNYANHFDVFSDLAGIYLSNIYYADKGNPELAGEISGYWNDRKLPTEQDITLQNNMYANVIASAERAWKGGGDEYIETSGVVLPVSGKGYDELVDFERRLLFHKDNTLPAGEVPYVEQMNIRWYLVGPYANGGDANAVFAPENGIENLTDTITEVVGAAPNLRHTWGDIVPGYFTEAGIDNTAYAYTYIYSPVEQEAGALIEFQNYSRSEKDLAPDAGKWDRKGSRIWLNDKEIMPPVWTNSGKAITNEDDLGNENFTKRPPIKVQLNPGWNKVLVKLPYVKVDGVRLNRWMFTFVLTDETGAHALPGIVYSPTRTM